MTRSSPIFSQKQKLKSRESLSNELTSAALPRPFILTWHVHVKYQHLASLPTPSVHVSIHSDFRSSSLLDHKRSSPWQSNHWTSPSPAAWKVTIARRTSGGALLLKYFWSWPRQKGQGTNVESSQCWSHHRALLHTCGFCLRPPWCQVFVDGARLTKARGSAISKTRIHMCLTWRNIFPNPL